MILDLLKDLFGFLNGFMSWLSTERLRKLGRLEAEKEQADQAIHELRVSAEVEARPTPTSKHAVLGGLLRPEDRSE